jgi:hypothetical protein
MYTFKCFITFPLKGRTSERTAGHWENGERERGTEGAAGKEKQGVKGINRE